MTRLQMKGAATLIFIPIFLLIIGLGFCSQAKAAKPIDEVIQPPGMSDEQFSRAKEEAKMVMGNPLTRSLLLAAMLGTQAAGINEWYDQQASIILAKYMNSDHPVWKELEELGHTTRAIQTDMQHGLVDLTIKQGIEREQAAGEVRNAASQFERGVSAMRAVVEFMHQDLIMQETGGEITPDTGTLIIPELEPGR